MPRKCGYSDIWIFTPGEFSVIQIGAKSKAITISMSSQCGAYTQALKMRSLALLFLVGGRDGEGAVATNDWCVIQTFVVYENVAS